ncbi:Metallo-hydrolase/oxidoreductase [Pluteus cervinus]|uniref:Metallo-hydrolase/oxidoreductase n=1 Tax=Pluteus cervinus TaxID=181527 RepID=A0ACD3B545_9AGAR|nr:Metallo-hydrolase/oxidoreductase [Pluteus cervinus]
MSSLKSAFRATRLTATTFLIKEYDDVYAERPHIYAKIVPSADTILVVDMGCGGRSVDPDVEVTSLREFIETFPVQDNDGKALNPGGTMSYIIVTTHCHYDHILAIEQFAGSPILASSHSPEFLSPSALPHNTLCSSLGLELPQYTPTLVPHGFEIHTSEGTPTGVKVLHTPGHTPDELALYDETEKMLYVGDTLYEKERIIFPNEGSISIWFSSMDFMIDFVEKENRRIMGVPGGQSGEVLINAGHATSLRPALEVLNGAKAFLAEVVEGKELVKRKYVVRGEMNVEYDQESGQFSLRCPEKLVVEAQTQKVPSK